LGFNGASLTEKIGRSIGTTFGKATLRASVSPLLRADLKERILFLPSTSMKWLRFSF
jgi:hypothetical protein